MGITDLSTQLAAVSDALPDSQRWSTWHVMLLMVALLVFVGPLDYFIVVRLFKAPRLTWITLPVFIATACLFAIQGLNIQRGDFTTRQVGLLDVFEDAGEQRFRARTWSSLSARESRYAHTSTHDAAWILETAGDSGERSLMWSGRIENIFGGMYRPGAPGWASSSASTSKGCKAPSSLLCPCSRMAPQHFSLIAEASREMARHSSVPVCDCPPTHCSKDPFLIKCQQPSPTGWSSAAIASTPRPNAQKTDCGNSSQVKSGRAERWYSSRGNS
ncbi:MAG UNVERIFIED_CONTAM: hypothetical protein LVR18_31750 [Planctomycetaceae bacterium]